MIRQREPERRRTCDPVGESIIDRIRDAGIVVALHSNDITPKVEQANSARLRRSETDTWLGLCNYKKGILPRNALWVRWRTKSDT